MLEKNNLTMWLISFALLGVVSCGISSTGRPSDYADSDDTEPEPAHVATKSVFIEPTNQISSNNNDQSPANEPPPPPGISSSEDVFEQTDVPVHSGDRLDDIFQKIQAEIPFELSAPVITPGFDLFEVRIVKEFGNTSVVAFFGSQQVRDQYFYFVQGNALQRIESCEDLPLPPPSGAGANPTADCSSKDIDIGNVPARVLVVRHPVTNVLETHLVWNSNGVEFEMGSDTIDADVLAEIASTVDIIP